MKNSIMANVCSYCNFSFRDDQQMQFISHDHLFKSHSNEPNFKVYCNYPDCTRSYTKVKSLQKHWQRDHVDDEIIQGNDFQDDGEEPEEPNLHTNELHDSTNVQRHAAKFLLASKVDGNITQAALESVKESSESLIAAYLQDIRSNLEIKLRENDPQFELGEELKSIFQVNSLYQGLETEYMQNEYYQKNFNLVVSILLFLYYKKWASDYFKI